MHIHGMVEEKRVVMIPNEAPMKAAVAKDFNFIYECSQVWLPNGSITW